MKTKLGGVVTMVALCLAFARIATAQSTTNLWSPPVNGAWDNAGQWSLATAPADTDVLRITNATSSYTVSIGSGTAATTLTNYSLTLGFTSGTTTQTLSIVDAPATIVENATALVQARGWLSLSGSTLLIRTNLTVQGGTLLATNSTIVVSSTASGGQAFVVRSGGIAVMNGGSLIVTNPSANSVLQVGSPTIGNGRLFVTNTLFRAQALSVGEGAAFFVNSGLATTSTFGGAISISQSLGGQTRVTIEGGNYLFGGFTLAGTAAAGGIPTFTNRGATMVSGNPGNNSWTLGGATTSGSFVLDGGTSRVQAGSTATGKINIRGETGNTTTVTVVSGLLAANGGGNGEDTMTMSGAGAARFDLLGGKVVVTNGLGTAGTGRFLITGGTYNQTGGLLVADRVGIGPAVQGFTVGSAAEVRAIGAELLSNAIPLSATNAFKFDGKLTLTPVSGVITQTIRLAGLDLGGNIAGFSNNFSLGTLDLGAYTAANRLRLLSPHAAADPALYVGAISAIATNALISPFDVYYIPELNPVLFAGGDQGKYLLTGGGFLLPIPEPSTLWLLWWGGLAILGMRRRS